MSNKGVRRTLVLEEVSARESSGDEGGGGGAEQAEETEEEREIRELEAEVKGMAERIQHFRRTVPSRLARALSSQLAAQRRRLPLDVDAGAQDRASQGGAAGPQHEGTSETTIPDGDPEICERLHTFRAKICSNIDAMPNILKRINGCIARIKRADQNAVVIHSVFKKRRKI
ncbi:hypothetical protein Taro_040279 [Colocasia esculenta]|uniref:Uncharacterized protein n=1 Tax=Colocasia esculenta TaxID=4460 RepID=A0A843WY11_COLES|nr:hypothetical protein [Colocasia esculenta]